MTAVRLARVSGEVEALEGVWNGQPFSVDAPALLRYEAERVAIERLHVQARGSTLAVSGAWPLATNLEDGLLEIEARLDLSTLAQYAPAGVELSADGALLLEGTVRGNLAAIDPDLELTIDNGLVLSSAIDPGLSDLDLRARIAGGVATVEHFAGRVGHRHNRSSRTGPTVNRPRNSRCVSHGDRSGHAHSEPRRLEPCRNPRCSRGPRRPDQRQRVGMPRTVRSWRPSKGI